jgi:ParB family chromosome partitioning protein
MPPPATSLIFPHFGSWVDAAHPRSVGRFGLRRFRSRAASFKTQGILAPLLVRELEESKYEVVAGARRLRAATLAELEKLPVRVVNLTDAEAIEAQCVELSIAVKHFLRPKAAQPIVYMRTTG